MALIEQPKTSPYAPLKPEAAQSKLRTGKWDDDSLLALVVQDADTALAYENTKAFHMGWQAASALYQSPYQERYWENTRIPRASVPFYTVATAVNSLVPQIVNGLFYQDVPFMIEERPGTAYETARAIKEVLAYQLEDIDFKEKIRLGVMNVLTFGTQIWKWGWESYSRKRRILKLQDNSITLPTTVPGAPPTVIDPEEEQIEVEEVDEDINRPTFEYIPNIRNILVDPTLREPDIRKAKFVIHRMYVTFEDLDKLRGRDGYDIPSQEEVLSWFLPPTEETEPNETEQGRSPSWDAKADAENKPATIDPFNQPLELLERWDNEKVTVVIQRKKVIAKDENVYGTIPFLSVNWWDVPEAFYGLGLARTVGTEQRIQQGITNTALANMELALQGVYTRKRGKSVPTQPIRISPGRVIDVDDDNEIKPLERSPAVPEALQHLSMSQARVEQTSGSNEASTGIGGSTAHSNLGRTAAGANLIASGTGNRISDFVEKLALQVFLPFLYACYEMNRLLLPVASWKGILNDELKQAYLKDGGSIDEILKARVRFSITAGAKLQERRNMAQSLPVMTQFLLNRDIIQHLNEQHLKIDVAALMSMWFESSGWRTQYDVIVPMTAEEIQRMEANSPSAVAMKTQAAQAQADQAKEDQKLEHRKALLEQSNTERAAGEILRKSIEESATPEVVEGQPGNQGFGSLT